MKRIAILFACLAILCLSTCENEQLITLLRAPSELVSLEIVAYAGDAQLEGGAAMEPGFTTSVFNYTVYVSKDTDRFLVSASIDGNGTIEIMCEEDQETGTEHDFLDEESKVMILTVEREYMEVAEYRVTVIREETVPTATGVEISVTPGIGAFFIGRGVLPEFQVTAKLPSAGGVLSYQWYMNYENSNRGGTRINGATGDTYKMRPTETMSAQTVYYYAEITNTIDGKTGITESNPCRVTFLDINKLHEKSRGTMVNVPGGQVKSEDNMGALINWYYAPPEWETDGFSIGKYLVTWELWKYVFDHADAGGYRFARTGLCGNKYGEAFGNELHPVSMIGWLDALIWCNAYSEMNGYEPVYRDSNGNVVRDNRDVVTLSADVDVITNQEAQKRNGYRLPTTEEWYYAGMGANPGSDSWNNLFLGMNFLGMNFDSRDQYVWCESSGARPINNQPQTGEVGSLLPNIIGLYDMVGMLYQYTWLPGDCVGGEFKSELSYIYWMRSAYAPYYFETFIGFICGLRLARNKE